MKPADLKMWKGILALLIAVGTPMVSWASGESSIRASIIMSVVAGLTALHNWADSALSDRAIATPNSEKQP